MFSLNFGRIREAPIRGFHENDEEDQTGQEPRCFEVVGYQKRNLGLLIVTTDEQSSLFVETNLVKDDSPVEAGSIVSQGQKVASLVEVSPEVILCKTDKSKVDLDDANNLASAIVDLAANDQAKVVTLTSDRFANYQAEEVPEMGSFSRCLQTSGWKTKNGCRRLEQPNVIGGLPAAVLTLCEFQKKLGLLVVNYSDSGEADSISLAGFNSVLSATSDHAEPVAKDVVASRMKKYREKHISTDLYM